jgi:hypothetical protein
MLPLLSRAGSIYDGGWFNKRASCRHDPGSRRNLLPAVQMASRSARSLVVHAQLRHRVEHLLDTRQLPGLRRALAQDTMPGVPGLAFNVTCRQYARMATKMCASMLSSVLWKIGRIARSCLISLKACSTSVSWM